MFYSERQRQKGIIDREAAGENLWSTAVPDAFRVKLKNLVAVYDREVKDGPALMYDYPTVMATAQGLLTTDRGLESLTGSASKPDWDFTVYMSRTDDENYPDVLEALYAAIGSLDQVVRATPLCVDFERSCNKLLEDYRIAYSMHEGEIIPFESREMHVTVILPALRLLTQTGWEAVEASYQDALRGLSVNPADAITDATTALQDGLRKLGCAGGDLKTLLKSAKALIFQGEDQKLIEAID